MPKGDLLIDFGLCMACGACVQACPFSCLTGVVGARPDHKEYPRLIQDHGCTACGVCAQVCPEDCIRITRID